MLSDGEHHALTNLLFYGNVVVNGVSIIAASFVVAVIFSAMAIDKKTMNRVSIRITLAIAILDVLRSGFNLLTLEVELEGVACVIQEYLFNFMTLAYFFLNMSIATNLQLIFLNGYSFNPFWERGYWTASFGLAALISLCIPGGYLAGAEGSSKCMPGDGLVQHVWEWSYIFFWILVSVVYCSVIVALVITKLVRNEKNLSRALTKNTQGCDWQATRYNSIIKSLLYRM
ncbi:hypothetical protein DSO57_1024548 [Entomophthora muscae]|uniref:Uncharacterized protein n=1 Tax=Entomophthora muscae TaxID=34485 RepID=A0ACC2UPL2_9FUNG|nr:hypothetical protein DSO57_1024548 [Entomophthora muscae]